MNPYFVNPNELWGYLHSEFLKISYLFEKITVFSKDPPVLRPIRRRGYKDHGSISPDNPDKYIEDTLSIKKRELLEERYYVFLFHILEKIP